MPSTNATPAALPPPASSSASRSRTSTNKFTQKNNKYRDKLRALPNSKLLVVKARSANNTYISKAKAALLELKREQIDAIHEDMRDAARAKLKKLCRQHSILSMYLHAILVYDSADNNCRIYQEIHWVQKARKIDRDHKWPTINQILISEGLTADQLDNFDPDSKPGGSPQWDVDLCAYQGSAQPNSQEISKPQSLPEQSCCSHCSLRCNTNTT